MGIDVKLTLPTNPGIQIRTGVRRGLAAAGHEVIATSDALAPREDVPRHGYHMTETSFARVLPEFDSDAVVVGYGAFWAPIQNEDLTYHHENGEAKFLDKALLGSPEIAMATIAEAVRQELGL